MTALASATMHAAEFEYLQLCFNIFNVIYEEPSGNQQPRPMAGLVVNTKIPSNGASHAPHRLGAPVDGC
jgi:hypothetical protein